MKFLLTFSILACLSGAAVFARQEFDPRVDGVTEREVSGPVPVVFGRQDDGLPEEFRARGVITGVSFSRACGGVYWSGTVRLKLLDKVEGYPHDSVFVVVNCLEDDWNEERYLNQVVELDVSKLYPKYRKFRGDGTFYFEVIDNTLDSGGVPFYCTNAGPEGMLKSVGAGPD